MLPQCSPARYQNGKNDTQVHLQLLEDSGAPGHTFDLAMAASCAYGAALGSAIKLDPRRRGNVASSKGTLSK